MKRFLILVLFIGAAAGAVALLTKPTASGDGESLSAPGIASRPSKNVRVSSVTDVATETVIDEPSPERVDTAGSVTPVPQNAVVDSVAEFAVGQSENMRVDGALRLSDPAVAGQEGPVRGSFQSPEVQARARFDTLSMTYESFTPGASTLRVEVRVRFPSRGWSEWHPITMENLNLPIILEAPADAWQYRVSMSAQSAATSPRVEKITIIPRYAAATDAIREP
jgi:hypothetical protein